MIEKVGHALENELVIETPEHVELRFVLASLGNRFLACAIDHTIQLFAVLLVLLAAEGIGWGIQQWIPRFPAQTVLAVAILANFLLIFGYFVFFESWWNGQTPGKRWLGLRVICDDGRPVTFFQAMVRNLLRLVDMMPAAAIVPSYFIGILTIFLNEKNRRLGDLAGGTVVVRERAWESPAGQHRVPSSNVDLPDALAVQSKGGLPRDFAFRISRDTFDLVATFLRRRDQLETGPRSYWARRIREKAEQETDSQPWSVGMNDELYLESLHRSAILLPRPR